MLLLYRKCKCIQDGKGCNLHSTMLLLYLRFVVLSVRRIIIYIPLCFYFICIRPDVDGGMSVIYIPLCFYFICGTVFASGADSLIYIPLCFYFIPSPISTSFFFNTRILFVHPVSTLDSPQKSSSSHFTKYEFSLIFQALSISQQFSSISGRQSQEITCLIIIHSPELLRYPLLISAFKYD